MNILFVTFYYPPEVGAPQRRISEYAAALSKRGHRVSILTGFPNYPRGELIEPYRRRLYLRENLNGIEVLRVFHFFGSRNGKWGRALAEGSFAFAASAAALLEPAPDAVIVESPSLLSGWVGVFLKRLRGVAFVFHPSDLIPDFAVALGLLSPGHLSKWLAWMAQFFYQEADAIVAVTEGIRKVLLKNRIPQEKIHLIPNGVNGQYLDETVPTQKNGKFRVVYVGSHGASYNLELVLEAANRLPSGDFEFEFIGDGINRSRLEQRARALSHVQFAGTVPMEAVSERLRQADAMVVPLVANPALEIAFPSKVVDAMAAGLPVVLTVRSGEVVDTINRIGAGLIVEPDNPDALVEAFQFLQKNPTEAAAMGRRGHEYVKKTRLRSFLTEQLEGTLLAVLQKRSRR